MGRLIHLVEGSGGRWIVAIKIGEKWYSNIWQRVYCRNWGRLGDRFPVLEAPTLQELARLGIATFATQNGAHKRYRTLGYPDMSELDKRFIVSTSLKTKESDRMKYEEIMSQVGVKFIQSDEMRELLVRKISEMPSETAEMLYAVLEDAAKKELDAGMGGERHDGGARVIVHGVEMYVHGWFKLTPREWTGVSRRLKNQNDPEWPEYQRLKAKFEKKDV